MADMADTAVDVQALVVDDDMVNRMIASQMLKRMGWTVAEAVDGEAALTYLSNKSVAVVLLDISMPGLSGDQVCQKIRQAFPETMKIIAYTAHGMPEERKKFMESGFDALLIKPITKQSLLQVLTEVGAAP